MRWALLVVASMLVAGCAGSRPVDRAGPTPKPDGSITGEPDRAATPAPSEDYSPTPQSNGGPHPAAVSPSGGKNIPPESIGGATVFRAAGTTAPDVMVGGYDETIALGVRAMDLYVPANATALVVELAWTDPLQDLDLELHAPRSSADAAGFTLQTTWAACEAGQDTSRWGVYCNPAGRIGAPDAPSRIELSGPAFAAWQYASCEQPGRPEFGSVCNTWSIGFRTKEATAGVSWSMAASVFTEDAVPPGYTALR